MDATLISNQVVAKIESILNGANGRRRERLVSMAQVMGCLKDVVVNQCEWSNASGGTVANAYNYPASTTMALVAKVDGRIFVGLSACDAKSATPGRAFPALQPWRKGEGPRGNAAEKWAAFAKSGGVIELSGPEVDSLLENGGALMPPVAEVAGQRFGRLTAVRFSGRYDRGGTRLWECRCECGNPGPVFVTVNKLRSGNTKSCGCLQREKASRSGKLATGHSSPKVCALSSCGEPFLGTNKQRFCSRECKEADKLASRGPKRCGNPRCDRTISAARSDQNYCSVRCKGQARNPPVEPGRCPICGDPVPRKGRSMYCPGDCRRVAASRLRYARRMGSPLDQYLTLRTYLENNGSAQSHEDRDRDR